MSAPEPLRPPEKVVTREITRQARYVERLKLRRARLRKQLAELDTTIRNAERVLRQVVTDATTPAIEYGPIDREATEALIDRAMGQPEAGRDAR